MAPVGIRREVQLLVEGKDERNFFEAFAEHLGLGNVQIQVLDGKDNLREFLETLAGTTDFGKVKRIGIVRDADESAARAFQSVLTSLRNVNDVFGSSGAAFPVPDRPGKLAGGRPSVNVLILPGDGGGGMLETLLCRTFAGAGVDRCIDAFFRCAEQAARRPIPRPDKARAHAYLATTRDPHHSVGVAAKAGCWDLDHGAFDGVRNFLRSMEPDGTPSP